jgi:hypothetical protein
MIGGMPSRMPEEKALIDGQADKKQSGQLRGEQQRIGIATALATTRPSSSRTSPQASWIRRRAIRY